MIAYDNGIYIINSAVNRRVVSSSLTCGANLIKKLQAPSRRLFSLSHTFTHTFIPDGFLNVSETRITRDWSQVQIASVAVKSTGTVREAEGLKKHRNRADFLWIK